MHGGDKISSDCQNPCSFQSFVGAAELKACWRNLLVDMLYDLMRLSVESLRGARHNKIGLPFLVINET